MMVKHHSSREVLFNDQSDDAIIKENNSLREDGNDKSWHSPEELKSIPDKFYPMEEEKYSSIVNEE